MACWFHGCCPHLVFLCLQNGFYNPSVVFNTLDMLEELDHIVFIPFLGGRLFVFLKPVNMIILFLVINKCSPMKWMKRNMLVYKQLIYLKSTLCQPISILKIHQISWSMWYYLHVHPERVKKLPTITQACSYLVLWPEFKSDWLGWKVYVFAT